MSTTNRPQVSADSPSLDIDMRPAPKIELVEGEIASVALNPGDRVVLMFQEQLSADYRERLHATLRGWLPRYAHCLVLDGGARLGVIRASEGLISDPAAGDSK